MFPSVPYVPAYMASQELSSTTSTTTTTTVTTNTTTTITSGFNLYLNPSASPWMNTTGMNASATMTVNSIVTPVMTYGPLESMANNWNYQLQEQEKQYFYQANQFQLWNQILFESSNEIALLHNEMERVKIDQSRLEQELDIILFQQKELEHMLTPIEELLKEQNGPLNVMYVNKEYEMIYRLAEIIDAELKRMSQDLKDIIVYLNSLANPADATEPLEQIYKILNAHMESLQWISHNSVIMQKKVEEVANAVEEYRRKEQDAMNTAFE
ncbi:nucleoporin-62 C-terminal-like protein isoform X1 [Mastomys coucha]|uniref:nucleoporin-62 C-terminal-like protein isoform X1 n=1 Tax=Mastomys coucha TaxID=35658 RepID=UPI00126283F5|nr:nucleoporin-62 C-terminal-like protein isoform X1 [Mastomys coucha]XP_031224534.1 nucleoporin-62 C-terminal-like protein isoform X1 [Mastomys coucha]XP_031224545.1 nucleoporin-62 C-terminal-like protein isoform X1 [Mastomys coucha]XP_031224562.1 nucleoporin-62 C-terminal-like protein isoform X1 [Mastomys coucha]XP_031224567.1 nucleoporin-62 C-terminal-like protein isoform X1 [Mastomys coucha]XP_031224573.1 nucleoporin-62 C-terminal-like protein isoform X1 [Mastomys coucha]